MTTSANTPLCPVCATGCIGQCNERCEFIGRAGWGGEDTGVMYGPIANPLAEPYTPRSCESCGHALDTNDPDFCSTCLGEMRAKREEVGYRIGSTTRTV